jgi:hypothetical protein
VKSGVFAVSKRNQNTGMRLSRIKADAQSPNSEKGIKSFLLAGFIGVSFAIILR